MAITPSSTTPRLGRPRTNHRVDRAVQKVQDLLSVTPEELVDRDTLSTLLMAAEEAQYAAQDAERYHGLWMEAQDEMRRLARGTVLNVGENPPEPPNRTVVIDCEGDAWQRDDRNGEGIRWECSGSDPEQTGKTWTGLLASYGPVRLVYTPEA